MKKKIIGIGLFLCWLVPASALASPLYSGLVVVGDSFSDTGNNAVVFDQAFGGQRTSVPLTPPDIIPTAPYPSDRYSNGPVWVEQFAAELGLSAQASRLGGTNYAHGGANTGPAGAGFPPSLLDQVDQFLADADGSASADNLYVIAGGGNDARDALVAAATGNLPVAFSIIDAFWNNIASMVTDLHGAGATDFLVWNVPDVGLAPAVQAQGPEAVLAGTFVAQQMNTLLDTALAALEGALAIDIFQFDAFGLTGAIVGNPQAFGLDNATFPCALSEPCIANPNGHFFWDGIHPTTAGHAVIAQAVLPLVTASVPEPGSLGLMVLGLFGLGWVGSRRVREAAA